MSAAEYEGPVGAASSVKMIRSIMMKGLEALVCECVLAGQKAGVIETVLDSLDDTYPGFDWKKRSAYMLERMMTHGVRRAAEMREVALTVDLLGSTGAMSRASVGWQQRIGELGLRASPEDVPDYVLADRILAPPRSRRTCDRGLTGLASRRNSGHPHGRTGGRNGFQTIDALLRAGRAHARRARAGRRQYRDRRHDPADDRPAGLDRQAGAAPAPSFTCSSTATRSPARRSTLVVKDDTGAADVTKRLAEELIVNDHASVLMGFGLTPLALAAAPVATEAKVPEIVTAAATAMITEKSPYIVRTSFTLPQAAGADGGLGAEERHQEGRHHRHRLRPGRRRREMVRRHIREGRRHDRRRRSACR